ncbi:hypothetical protein ACOMHN_025272 [Nucella lapillus]
MKVWPLGLECGPECGVAPVCGPECGVAPVCRVWCGPECGVAPVCGPECGVTPVCGPECGVAPVCGPECGHKAPSVAPSVACVGFQGGRAAFGDPLYRVLQDTSNTHQPP